MARPRRPKLPTINEFELGSLIGQGAMAKVHKARDKRKMDSKWNVAIKIISKSALQKYGLVSKAYVERDMLARLARPTRHPNIIFLESAFVSESNVYFVLELASGGNLADMLKRFDKYYLDPELARVSGVIEINYVSELSEGE
eukprot:GHVN01013829.1.p1 GENE.GHVN01013829.1~~GHVN01013829.1.p1  ORF type:complete len:143 (+),score=18.72 GHVN01013829.1:435-863(+)